MRENNEQIPNKNIFSKFKNKRTANQQEARVLNRSVYDKIFLTIQFHEKIIKLHKMASSGSEYPLVDFSDIPGCESPLSAGTGRSFRTTDSSLASSTVSKSTKSRISSIFSQTLDTSDDDVFGLTQSARKIRHSHHQTKISTGLLIEIEEQIESPSSLTDWERLKKEAQAIAGEMTGETSKAMTDKVIDFDEILSKS